MAWWPIIGVLWRHSIASWIKQHCVLVLEVVLWRALPTLLMRSHFVADCCVDLTVGVGSMMLTLVIHGSKSGVLAQVLLLLVQRLVVCRFLGAVGLLANAVTRDVLTL